MSQMILTCEHGGNKIPARYKKVFSKFKSMLNSHKGFDEYALPIAKGLKVKLRAPLVYSETSRLLIDLNRSLDHENLFSEITTELPQSEKERIISSHYFPFRNEVSNLIKRNSAHRTLHVSVHTFTPSMHGKIRTCEIGLLFDPSRPFETCFAKELRRNLKKSFPDARIKMNYPYRGIADGHTTLMRKCLPDSRYAGIEIELNQNWAKQQTKPTQLKNTVEVMAEAITQADLSCRSHTDK